MRNSPQHFYTFPDAQSEKLRYTEWARALGKSRKWDVPPPKGASKWYDTVICSVHFQRNQFQKGGKKLIIAAMPTLYWESHPGEPPKKRKAQNFSCSELQIYIQKLQILSNFIYLLND